MADDGDGEDPAEPKDITRAGDSSKTRRHPGTSPKPETLQRRGGESCIMLASVIVFNLTRSFEWWHRRDQAPIQLETLSPVATHDLLAVLLWCSSHHGSPWDSMSATASCAAFAGEAALDASTLSTQNQWSFTPRSGDEPSRKRILV